MMIDQPATKRDIEILTAAVATLTSRIEALEAGDRATVKTLEGQNLRLEALESATCGERWEARDSTTGTMRRYTSPPPADNDGRPHVYHTEEIADPAPVPKWRRMVDDESLGASTDQDTALKQVLVDLTSCIGGSWYRRVLSLARIVAVCEAQVGAGWQADPAGADATEYEGGWMGVILYSLADWQGHILWSHVGDAAAAWLKELCDEGGAA